MNRQCGKELLIKSSVERPPIPFADYCRIFSVISSVVEDHTDVHHACICFAMIGAHLLREHYGLQANAVSGAAAYALGRNLRILTFGRIVDGCLVAGLDNFHCWIECKGHVIDFLAPLFPENVAECDSNAEVPRRVFMKPLSRISPTLLQAGSIEGAFQVISDGACEENMVKSFHRTPVAGDLQEICNSWYRRPPKKMTAELSIQDDLARIKRLRLKSMEIKGFW